MKTKYTNLLYTSLLVAILIAVACSARHGKAWNDMDRAESLMTSNPDSALSVLESIAPSDLTGREGEARYALLMSMALDKNYVDTTTFSILQPAIDYYLQHGTPDEKLRTLYYQGRIYQNQGNDEAAMQSFLNAEDIKDEITDSLLYAHLLVSQATIYYQQYKTSDFVDNNILAANIYGEIGKHILEIKSYSNALDGEIILNNRIKADSILEICSKLFDEYQEGEEYIMPRQLSYTIAYGKDNEIRSLLPEFDGYSDTDHIKMDLALGYSKIGEGSRGLEYLQEVKLSDDMLDSIKYLSIKSYSYESIGDYKKALDYNKRYSRTLEEFHESLFNNELLFTEKKHAIEVANLIVVNEKNYQIWCAISCICALLAIIALILYFYYRARTKRIIAEKENEQLRLRQEILAKEKQNAELELKQKALDEKRIKLEQEALIKEQDRLKLEKEKAELESENLRLKISQLEGERDNLTDLLQEQHGLTKPLQDVIKMRLDMLNAILAKEITDNDLYAEPYKKWIESVKNDKDKFMNSTRMAFSASHPKFTEYLKSRDLSDEEINYVCLYALGLRVRRLENTSSLNGTTRLVARLGKNLG